MNTMTSPHANGRSKRPSLSEQINRLDSILDGLSDGLNDAVADAVKAAVAIAVKEALREILTSPAILAKLQPLPVATVAEPAPTPAPKRTTLSQRLSNGWQRV